MRIGLIAMSGIRVRDTELLGLGLTLPGFVERSKTIASLPSLGLLTLAAMTPARHSVHYVEVRDVEPVAAPPGEFDLVALSSYSAQIGEAYALADRFRARGIPVVMGGPHVSALPEEALDHSDAVVVGEGELHWADVLADAEAGRLRGVYAHAGRTFDLALAPVPAYHLLEPERYNRLTVQASRGCPHHCEFCAGSVLLGERYRQKPMGHVLNEVRSIRALWDRPFIELADDDAFVDRAYWRELCRELARERVRWFAETDVSIADDDELLEQLREAGCREVLLGLESPTAAELGGIELRSDWKRRHAGSYVEAVRRIQEHGIRVNACFVIGLDGQGPEVFEAIPDFVAQATPFDVQVTILTPFPGTPLHARLAAQGRLTAPGQWERCTLFDLSFRPERMSADELVSGFKRLAVELYGDDATRARRRGFRAHKRRGCAPCGAREVEDESDE